eukprot:12015956-Alexandrium_andersonii.AAC.1
MHARKRKPGQKQTQGQIHLHPCVHIHARMQTRLHASTAVARAQGSSAEPPANPGDVTDRNAVGSGLPA